MKIRLHCLLVVLALFRAICTDAAPIIWTNSVSANWSNPLNWSPNQVPGAGDITVITNGGNYTVTLDVDANVAGLILGASSGVTIQSFYTGGQTLTVNGPIQVTPQGQLNLNGGVIAGTNGLTGILTWSGGSMKGTMTVTSNGVLNIVAGNNFFTGLVLTNYGMVNWANASLLGGSGLNASIYNYGLWNAQSDNTFAGGYVSGTSLFDNFGTFRKSGNTGATVLDSAVVFNNAGTVDVQTGTLNINAGTSSSGGSANTAGNAQLNYNNYTFASSTIFTGSGAVVLTGNITMNGVMSAPNLQMNSATLTGTNVLVGTLRWSTSSAGGAMTIASNSVLNFVAGNNFFTGLVLTNYGTVNWTNASLLGGSGLNASIYNYGLWNAQSDNTFAGGYVSGTSLFDNFGTFRKSGNTGATVLDSAVVFNNTGTVDVQTGTLQLSGGATLAGGNLIFGIASTSNFGMLNLPGSIALTGTLGVTFNGYTPQVGDSFPLITYGSKTGVFTAFNLPSGVNWQQTYGSTTYKLSVGLPLNFALAVGQPAWTANGFNLAISGPVGSNYTVFVTTNLTQNNWSVLSNFVSVFTSTPFTDTGATKFGTNRFYRLYLH